MEQRKITRVFTFESDHILPYTQSDTMEPEKTLSWYAHAMNTFSAIGRYAKNLILSFYDKKEQETTEDDDLEAGRRSPKSPLRTMPKETWTNGASV